MRILQLRFRNLNSLDGEWEIDLTHPCYTADGIFAIIGPTGAGKTTILDAICLALYGRTPRLNRISKNGNEIISRQTGECFAEVLFEAGSGRYRCHWSQHRARRKPGGELQAPKHEISDADTGRILEAKIRGVAEYVESVTGMDFERFTRSMLLAQGGFAAFLQADADERAPILEQITGTEIYSRISMRVHERRTAERNRLELLQSELAGMQLLSPDDERALAAGLEQKARREIELNQQLAGKNQAITWIERIAGLEEELQQLGRLKEDLQSRVEHFTPDSERLRLANQALELAGDYSTLTAIRREQAADLQALELCQHSLPDLVQRAQQAEERMQAALRQLEASKSEQLQALPVIRKVRELDLKIAEKEAPVKAARASIIEVLASRESLNTRQHDDCAVLDARRAALNDLGLQLQATKSDQGLVEQLTGIQQRFEVLRGLQKQLAGRSRELEHADRQLQERTREWQTLSLNLEKERHRLEGIQTTLAEQQADFQQALDHRELVEWRGNQSRLMVRRDLLARALETVHSQLQSREKLVGLERERTMFEAEAAALVSTLAIEAGKQHALEQEMEFIETQLILLKRIEDLSQARHQLQDGEACPLCGAREHPYAEGNIPLPDEARQRLAAVREQLKSATDRASGLRVRQARLDKDVEQTEVTRQGISGRIEETEQLLSGLCRELSPDQKLSASDSELGSKLTELEQHNTEALARANQILEAAESAEKELNELRKALEETKKSFAVIERETQVAAFQKESDRLLLAGFDREVYESRNRQEHALGLLREEVKGFGIAALEIDALELVEAQLISRRTQWVERQQEQGRLDREIAALEARTRHQADQLCSIGSELAKQQDGLEALRREQEAAVLERRRIFAERHPDDEEGRLVSAIVKLEKLLETARKESGDANQALGQQASRIKGLKEVIESRRYELKISEEGFLQRLAGSGFGDEARYLAASLTESERKQLTLQARRFADEEAELRAREEEKRRQLECERQKEITQETLDELKDALTVLTANQRDLQLEIGGVRQQLNDNERLKQTHQQLAQAINAQKRECTRWELLHELIGSADGKKFRNFAQGLTFESVVGHANRQLQKMTDRYLLVRDAERPLELNVIDDYRAGEIRSTKNLSGGESFIVSLALALGLSNMASKHVRVDSLFLDEGFGTLDEEALDTALETLAGLQQEGKLIGVISHVPALKARITTQIELQPQPGGRSLVSGPGCRQLS